MAWVEAGRLLLDTDTVTVTSSLKAPAGISTLFSPVSLSRVTSESVPESIWLSVEISVSVTVKPEASEACAPLAFVTVMSLAALEAEDDITMPARIDVELTKVTELTVMPVPLKVTVGICTNPVPVMDISRDFPFLYEEGETEVTETAVTVKEPVAVEYAPPGLANVTSRAPVAAEDEIVILAVTESELTNTTEFTVIPAPLRVTVGVETKFDPVMVSVPDSPCMSEEGETELIVIPVIVRAEEEVASAPLVLVTVMSLDPAAAELETAITAVREEELTKTTEFTVMPVPLKDTAGVETKFSPVIVIVSDSPWITDDGEREEMDSVFTARLSPSVKATSPAFVTVRSLFPAEAEDETVTPAVKVVELTKITEFTVIPVPEKATSGVAIKLVPVMVMVSVSPCMIEEGEMELTVTVEAATAKAAVALPCPEGLVTVMILDPFAAPAERVTLALMADVLRNATELTVIPEPEKETVGVDRKLLPVIVRSSVSPGSAKSGDTLLTVSFFTVSDTVF